jgi:solute carrier family 39 (zinc transporter), member 9
MALSQSQLRLISSIGVGLLVGTSLIVILPEGIGAMAAAGHAGQADSHAHSHGARATLEGVVLNRAIQKRNWVDQVPQIHARSPQEDQPSANHADVLRGLALRRDDGAPTPPSVETPEHDDKTHEKEKEPQELQTIYIGLSLILGFVLMFLIDRLPRHATESLQGGPQTRHISLDNLGRSSVPGDEESEGFLGSLTPTPKQSKGLATTTGLVIHAAADGIAMGASATSSDTKLGFIIFIAIMVHKAPAAFGLTSVLLKQGLSKRAARGHLVVFSLAAPVGALTTWAIIGILGGGSLNGESGQWWTGMLLLFSAGTFL